MSRGPLIAAVEEANEFEVQALFAALAGQLAQHGLKVVGLLSEHHGLEDRACTSGFLADLATGERYPIYRDTVPEGKTCHVDADGALKACTAILNSIPEADLVVLSKFGKLEAAGEGLARAFETAMAAGIPILTTVSQKHVGAWHSFSPGAVRLSPDRQSITAWAEAAVAASRETVSLPH